jgi:hypothetical protein
MPPSLFFFKKTVFVCAGKKSQNHKMAVKHKSSPPSGTHETNLIDNRRTSVINRLSHKTSSKHNKHFLFPSDYFYVQHEILVIWEAYGIILASSGARVVSSCLLIPLMMISFDRSKCGSHTLFGVGSSKYN